MGATTRDASGLAQFVGAVCPWGKGKAVVVKLHVDMEDVCDGLSVAGIDGSSADVIQLWDIPAGTMILGAMIDVTTACTDTGSATVAIGDGDSTAGYLAATSIKTAAKTGTILTDAYGAASKVYAATDTLDLLFGGTEASINSGVFDIYLYCIMYGDYVG